MNYTLNRISIVEEVAGVDGITDSPAANILNYLGFVLQRDNIRPYTKANITPTQVSDLLARDVFYMDLKFDLNVVVSTRDYMCLFSSDTDTIRNLVLQIIMDRTLDDYLVVQDGRNYNQRYIKLNLVITSPSTPAGQGIYLMTSIKISSEEDISSRHIGWSKLSWQMFFKLKFIGELVWNQLS